jgi:hypothetical protein
MQQKMKTMWVGASASWERRRLGGSLSKKQKKN